MGNSKEDKFIDSSEENELITFDLPMVKYFRELGFFEKYRSQSDEELYKTLLKELRDLAQLYGAEMHGNSVDPDDIFLYYDPPIPLSDFLLLILDDDRVGYGSRKGLKFEDLIKCLSRISCGVFMPEDIEVIDFYDPDEEPSEDNGFDITIKGDEIEEMIEFEDVQYLVEVRFIHKDLKVRIITVCDDIRYLNLHIIPQINILISKTGLQFYYKLIDMPVFIISLTSEQKERLKKERGWSFYKHWLEDSESFY